MGSVNTRFGRNVPLAYIYPEEPAIFVPNPRTVSRELLTRQTFQPATSINLLVAAWVQFMIHDWFSHGKNQKENPWKVPLSDDDPDIAPALVPLRERLMAIAGRPVNIQGSRDVVLYFRGELIGQPYLVLIDKPGDA